MQGRLARIAADARQVVEAIYAAFGIDAEVVDADLRIVAGTGIYARRLGEFEEGGVGGGLYGRVLESGVAEAALDTTDPHYDPIVGQGGVMLEQADFAAPILLHGRAVGVVGLVAFTDQQAAQLRARSAAVLNFCQRLAHLLANRLEYLEQSDDIARAHSQLQLIQDSVDEGIVLVGPDGELLVVSRPAQELTGYSGREPFWPALFDEPLPAGSARFRVQARSGHLLIADARPLRGCAGTLVVLRSAQAVQQLAYDLTNARTPVRLSHLVGRSPQAESLRRDVGRIALDPSKPVLIWGEPGAGASAVAAALHDNGPHSVGPFLAVHVSATAGNALEGAIFGSASRDGGVGALSLAVHGTLLFDHIDQLPLRLQERLLVALREGTHRAGRGGPGLESRIVATTTVRLADLVRRGEFLGDLYAYLSQAVVRLAPLRQRKGDIPETAQAFLERQADPLAGAPLAFAPEAMRLLVSHSWPGNLRELAAVIELAARRAGELIGIEHLPERLHRLPQLPARPLDEMVQSFEQSLIVPLLRAYGDDTEGKRRVAQHLGVSLSTLYRKLQHFQDG